MRLVSLDELLAAEAAAYTISGNCAFWRWDAGFAGLSQWGSNRPEDIATFFAFIDGLLLGRDPEGVGEQPQRGDAGHGRINFLADNRRMELGDHDLRAFEQIYEGMMRRRARVVASHRKMASVLPENAIGLAIAGGQEAIIDGDFEHRTFGAYRPALGWLERPDAELIERWLEALPDAARALRCPLAEVRAELERDSSLSGAALAHRLAMSFRSLQRALAAAGSSLASEQLEARIRRARKLLLEDHTKVETVARAVGFRSVSHFIRVYRDRTGETPGQVRARRRSDGG